MTADLSALREGDWTLDELVALANRHLPAVLPKEAVGRVTEAVSQRLVRYYATLGLVDEPLKEGREARYLYRHLLQVLAVRRLLAEGLSTALAGQALAGRGDADLEALLTGGLAVQLVPQRQLDDRAEFLRRVRARAGLEPAGPASAVAADPRPAAPAEPPPVPAAPLVSRWTRLEVLDGLELLVRDDFRLPATRLGDDELLQLLKVTLLQLQQERRGSP